MEAGQQPLRVAVPVSQYHLCQRPWWAWATSQAGPGPASSWFSAVCPNHPWQRFGVEAVETSPQEEVTSGGQWGRDLCLMSRVVGFPSSSSVAEVGGVTREMLACPRGWEPLGHTRAPAAFRHSGAARGPGPAPTRLSSLPGCCARFSARSSLYIHAKKHLQDVAPPKSRCPVSSCDRALASKHSMKAHMSGSTAGTQVGPWRPQARLQLLAAALDARPRATAALPAHLCQARWCHPDPLARCSAPPPGLARQGSWLSFP